MVQHPRATPGTFENEKVELYRLDQDPGEANNLSKAEPQRASRMLKQLKDWYQDTQNTATSQPGGWLKQGS